MKRWMWIGGAALLAVAGGAFVVGKITNDRKRGTMNAERLQRARSAQNHGIRYKLGQGGTSPADSLPSLTGLCDCSGFIAWVIGLARSHTIVKGMWGISTDSIYADAKGGQVVFERIPAPVPGCFGVYPDSRDAAGKHHEGHIAMVVDVATKRIIDCSDSQDGITEHPGAYFWTNKATIWCQVREQRAA